MSQRAVWILAALAGLLGAYVLLFERTSLTTKELEGRQGRVLGAFVRERVDRLEIQRGGKTVVLERKPLEDGSLGSWSLVEPDRVEADQDAVDQVLGELEWLSARRSIEKLSLEDQKRFGLSAPRYRIWYRAGGERHLIAVGNEDVHGQSVYVRTEDPSTAHVVPKTLTEALAHPLNHFRSKQFLGVVVNAWARKIEIERGDQVLVLSRAEGQAHWQFQAASEPPPSFADSKRVNEVVTALGDLRAVRYVEEGPLLGNAKVALARPELAVRVSIMPDAKREDQTPRLIDLRVSGACPDHPSERLARAGDQGPVVCVTEDALKSFLSPFASYRQLGLLGIDPSRIEGFELASGTQKFVLSREGEKWLGADKEEVDREAVETWLAELTTVKALRFQPLSEDKESGHLLLNLADSKSEKLAWFALAPDGTLSVRRGDEPARAVFEGALLTRLLPTPNRFSSLSPWENQQPSEIGSLEATALAVPKKAEKPGNLTRSLAFGEGGWSQGGTALAPATELRVRELVKNVLKTRALSFVAETAQPGHGLSRPSATLLLRKKGGGQGQGLRMTLGAESEKGVFARFDDGPVFELDPLVLGWVRELAGGAPAPEPARDAGAGHEADEDDEDGEGDHPHLHEH